MDRAKWETAALSCFLVTLLLGAVECQSGGGAGQAAATASVSFFATVLGYVVIGGILLVICGLFSLVAFLVCMCHEKYRKNRVLAHVPTGSQVAPNWSTHLVLEPQFLDKGFAVTSDGLQQVGLYKVMRMRKGLVFTDGARWDVPMVSGKHLFEVIWPWSCRGHYATVGVGTGLASLKVKGSVSLVGQDLESWGLDIVRRRVIHGGRIAGGQCPTDGSFVPDRFLMFVDLDSGAVGFGTEVTYWGDVISGLPTDRKRPLYVMAGLVRHLAEVQIYYKGSADPNSAQFPSPDMSTAISSYSMPPAPGPAYVTAGPSAGGVAPPGYTEKPGPSDRDAPAPPPDVMLYENPPPYRTQSPPPKYSSGDQ